MPRITFAEPLREALKFCRPCVVAPRSHRDDLDLAPLGVEVPRALRVDPPAADGALRSRRRLSEKGRARFVLAGRLIEAGSGRHAPIHEESASSAAKE